MRIAVLGTGYVGLVSGVCLAEIGHNVTCLDIRPEIISTLQSGTSSIYEPGMDEVLKTCLANGNIRFSLPTPEVISEHELLLIAVGTPSTSEGIDLSQVERASVLAGKALSLNATLRTIVVKSTVVPGTTLDVVTRVILENTSRSRESFGIGMNPEFLREGCAIEDFNNPDRIVIGFEDEIARTDLLEMYNYFDCEKIEVNTKTAELIKYANNYFLALLISATNEIANLSAVIGGIDPVAVMKGVVADGRWRNKGGVSPGIVSYLLPGPGFGGSCFPKDVVALKEFGLNLGLPMLIASSILTINEAQPEVSVSHAFQHLDLKHHEKALVLGLAFKPDTDDVRESPAFGITKELKKLGLDISVYDPLGLENFMSEVEVEVTPINHSPSISDFRVIVLVTPWQEFSEMIYTQATNQIIFDPRRALDRLKLADGVQYLGIGVTS